MPTSQSPAPRPSAGLPPLVPLLLLESMRDLDRPDEVLEGEDLAASMPRRLGLSDVVLMQIHRLKGEVKRKRPQPPEVVDDLVRLVLRRPDAVRVFEEAGRRLAAHAWERRSRAGRRVLGVAPARLRLRSARRAASRLFGPLAGEGGARLDGDPLRATVREPLASRADPDGDACALYTGLLAETLRRHAGGQWHVHHLHRMGEAGECEWTAIPLEG